MQLIVIESGQQNIKKEILYMEYFTKWLGSGEWILCKKGKI